MTTDRKWINASMGALAVVLITASLVPDVEALLNWIIIVPVVVALAVFALREGWGELLLARELRAAARPPHPDDIAAWLARQPKPPTTPLDARPVWQVVPGAADLDARTQEIEGPR